jgi:hypothetical protein
MATENTARLAVLIDADNAQPSITEGLLAEVANYAAWLRIALRVPLQPDHGRKDRG